jgi:hypothetical protein
MRGIDQGNFAMKNHAVFSKQEEFLAEFILRTAERLEMTSMRELSLRRG